MSLTTRPTTWLCTTCRLTTSSTRPTTLTISRRAAAATTRHNSTSPSASSSSSSRQDGPFRMAVIGSGPAGFYTAYRVMSKIPQAKIDMYEALPVPYGLVRFGVAPDHPEVKNCRDKFEEVAASPNFTFIGNTAVGDPAIAATAPAAADDGNGAGAGQQAAAEGAFPGSVTIPLPRLMAHYDAVVLAYGAARDKKLGLESEDSLRNIFSAREFVGWYNGLPEYASLNPDLTRGEETVIVGQGNVALDCARMLLEDVNVLRKTDVTDNAVETLSKSRIKRVHVVGRRGPMQAAFSIKEVRELMKLRDVGFHPVDMDLMPAEMSTLPRPKKRLMDVIVKGSLASVDRAPRSWSLDFALTPTKLEGDGQGNVEKVWFERNKLSSIEDPKATVLEREAGMPPELEQFGASMVLRSIGYKSLALPGMQEKGILFDDRKGTVKNDGLGRVLQKETGSDKESHKPGVYCAGWVKRGPTGVIASTMDDAFVTADVIAADWLGGSAFMTEEQASRDGWDALKREVAQSRNGVVDWAAWERIDEAEKKRGELVGKEREKFTSTTEMLKAAGLV